MKYWFFFRLYEIHIHVSLGFTNIVWDHFGLGHGRMTPAESGQMIIVFILEIWNSSQYFPIGLWPDWFLPHTVLADLLLFAWVWWKPAIQVSRAVIFLEISSSLDFYKRTWQNIWSASHMLCVLIGNFSYVLVWHFQFLNLLREISAHYPQKESVGWGPLFTLVKFSGSTRKLLFHSY